MSLSDRERGEGFLLFAVAVERQFHSERGEGFLLFAVAVERQFHSERAEGYLAVLFVPTRTLPDEKPRINR